MTNDNGLTPNPNDENHDAADASHKAGASRNTPDSSDRPTEVPQGELFNDGETRMAWAAINTLSEGQLHELLGVMQSKAMLPELRPGKYAQRVAKIVSAFTEGATQLMREQQLRAIADVELTEEEYERRSIASTRSSSQG